MKSADRPMLRDGVACTELQQPGYRAAGIAFQHVTAAHIMSNPQKPCTVNMLPRLAPSTPVSPAMWLEGC